MLRHHDALARAARIATFGQRRYSVPEREFAHYLGEIAQEAERAKRAYGMLVLPGIEVTRNHVRAKKNAHIIALGVSECITADQSPEEVLKEIRRHGAISIACHPHHRTTRRIEISLYSWKTLVRSRKTGPAIKAALTDNANIAITLYRGETWPNARARERR